MSTIKGKSFETLREALHASIITAINSLSLVHFLVHFTLRIVHIPKALHDEAEAVHATFSCSMGTRRQEGDQQVDRRKEDSKKGNSVYSM